MYKQMFAADEKYMVIVNKYKQAQAALEKKIQSINYSNADLQAELNMMMAEVSSSLTAIRNERISEAEDKIAFAQKKKDVGFATRPDVKELEVHFKLLSDQDIKHYAATLKSDDVLELTILRLELKSRNFEEADTQVSTYMAMNKVGGMNPGEESDFRHYSERLKNYSSVSPAYIVADNSLQALDHYSDEMKAVINNRKIMSA